MLLFSGLSSSSDKQVTSASTLSHRKKERGGGTDRGKGWYSCPNKMPFLRIIGERRTTEAPLLWKDQAKFSCHLFNTVRESGAKIEGLAGVSLDTHEVWTVRQVPVLLRAWAGDAAQVTFLRRCGLDDTWESCDVGAGNCIYLRPATPPAGAAAADAANAATDVTPAPVASSSSSSNIAAPPAVDPEEDVASLAAEERRLKDAWKAMRRERAGEEGVRDDERALKDELRRVMKKRGGVEGGRGGSGSGTSLSVSRAAARRHSAPSTTAAVDVELALGSLAAEEGRLKYAWKAMRRERAGEEGVRDDERALKDELRRVKRRMQELEEGGSSASPSLSPSASPSSAAGRHLVPTPPVAAEHAASSTSSAAALATLLAEERRLKDAWKAMRRERAGEEGVRDDERALKDELRRLKRAIPVLRARVEEEEEAARPSSYVVAMLGSGGHVACGVLNLLVMFGLGGMLGDGRALAQAKPSTVPQEAVIAAVADGDYGLGLILDTHGNFWTDAGHITKHLRCPEELYEQYGKWLTATVLLAGLLLTFVPLCNLKGLSTVRRRWGKIAVVLLAAATALLGTASWLTTSILAAENVCHGEPVVCTPKPWGTCDLFTCSEGLSLRRVNGLICPQSGCTDDICCQRSAHTCKEYRCNEQLGWRKRFPASNKRCRCVNEALCPCTDEVCCKRTCTASVDRCPAGTQNTGLTCGHQKGKECGELYCCRPSCKGFPASACPRGEGLRGDAPELFCPRAAADTTLCTARECCGSLYCTGVTPACLATTIPATVDRLNRNNVTCPSSGCTTEHCCDKVLNCFDHYQCDVAKGYKMNFGVKCERGGVCDDLTCCTPRMTFCADSLREYRCPPGYFNTRRGKSHVYCGTQPTDCDVSKCCELDRVDRSGPCAQPPDVTLILSDLFAVGYAVPTLAVAAFVCLANMLLLLCTRAVCGSRRSAAREVVREVVRRHSACSAGSGSNPPSPTAAAAAAAASGEEGEGEPRRGGGRRRKAWAGHVSRRTSGGQRRRLMVGDEGSGGSDEDGWGGGWMGDDGGEEVEMQAVSSSRPSGFDAGRAGAGAGAATGGSLTSLEAKQRALREELQRVKREMEALGLEEEEESGGGAGGGGGGGGSSAPQSTPSLSPPQSPPAAARARRQPPSAAPVGAAAEAAVTPTSAAGALASLAAEERRLKDAWKAMRRERAGEEGVRDDERALKDELRRLKREVSVLQARVEEEEEAGGGAAGDAGF